MFKKLVNRIYELEEKVKALQDHTIGYAVRHIKKHAGWMGNEREVGSIMKVWLSDLGHDHDGFIHMGKEVFKKENVFIYDIYALEKAEQRSKELKEKNRERENQV